MYGKIAILLQIVKPTIRASWPNVQFKYLFYEFNRNEIKGISLDLFTLCAWLTSSEARNLTHKYWFNVENHKYFIHIYRWARMDEDYRSPWCIDSVDLAYIMLPALHQPHYCLLNISSAFFLYLQNHIDNAFCFAVSSWIGLRMKRKSSCTTPTQTHTHNSIRQCVCVDGTLVIFTGICKIHLHNASPLIASQSHPKNALHDNTTFPAMPMVVQWRAWLGQRMGSWLIDVCLKHLESHVCVFLSNGNTLQIARFASYLSHGTRSRVYA